MHVALNGCVLSELTVGASDARVTALHAGSVPRMSTLSTTHPSYSDTVAVQVDAIEVSQVLETPLATHSAYSPEQIVRSSASVAAESTVDCRNVPSQASALQPSVRNGPDIAQAATSAQYCPRSAGVRSLRRLFPGTLVGIAPAELRLPPSQPEHTAAIPSAIAVGSLIPITSTFSVAREPDRNQR
jgi:hypothetical protein